MKCQAGSVLVGVLAISLAMTVAAGGFLMVAGNSSNDTRTNHSDQTLHYAAESAMYMGVRWVRAHAQSDHTADWDGSLVLTQGIDGYANIDGIQCKVTIQGIPGGPNLRTLTVTATAGTGKDVLTLVWTVQAVTADGAHDPNKCTPIMINWQESYTPGPTP